MTIQQAEQIVIPSSPADREAIEKVMKELSNSLTRSDSEKEYRRDALKELQEKYGVKAKYFRRMMNDFHKDSFEAKAEEQENYGALFETIFSLGRGPEAQEPTDEELEELEWIENAQRTNEVHFNDGN